MLTRRAFLTGKRVAMDIRDHDVGIDRQFSLNRGRWQIQNVVDRTYVEDLKDSS